MKKSELFFSFTQVLADWVAIIAAAAIAYQLRHTDFIQSVIQKDGLYTFSFEGFMVIALWFSPFVIAIFALEGLYNIRSTRKYYREIYHVCRATTIALVIVMIGFFLQREWFSSRFIIVAAWFFVVFFVVIGRLLLRSLQKSLLVEYGIGQYHVVLIGTGDKIKNLCRYIQLHPSLGYTVVAHHDYLKMRSLKKIQEQKHIDEVIVHESELVDEDVKRLYDFCQSHGITYKFLPTERQAVQFHSTIFGDEPVMVIEHTPLDGWGKIMKRLFDISVSAGLMFVTAPIVLLAALLIKIEDPHGPVFFRNQRVGENGELFDLFKIRYMRWKWCTVPENPDYEEALVYEKKLIRTHSERVGPIYKIKNDPRRLIIGRILERLSIDEFPQFYNVLKGDMSLVGPRPHQEREVGKYAEHHKRLLTIKPGITGMAQVTGRSDLDFEDEYRLDVFYIENWSPIMDILIMLKTIPAIIKSRKNNL